MTAVADPPTTAVAAVAALAAAVDELLSVSWSGLSDDGFLDVVQSVETSRRRLEAADLPLVAELDARGLPDRLLARGPRSPASRCRHCGRSWPPPASPVR
jgi:hypothetical protein